jgi:hypothetical protein
MANGDQELIGPLSEARWFRPRHMKPFFERFGLHLCQDLPCSSLIGRVRAPADLTALHVHRYLPVAASSLLI